MERHSHSALYLLLFLAVAISSIAPVRAAKDPGIDVKALHKCTEDTCVEQIIQRRVYAKYDETICKKLDGRQSPTRTDLGFLCRLNIYRNRAGFREKYRCDNDNLADYGVNLSGDVIVRLYADRLFRKIPEDIRVLPILDLNTAYENRSRFLTFILSLNDTVVRDGAYDDYFYDLFFCVTRDNPNRYIPYMEAISIGTDKYRHYVHFRYITEPPLLKYPVLDQLPKEGSTDNAVAFLLQDFNGDGKKDLAYLTQGYNGTIAPYICLYQKDKKECKLVRPTQFITINYDRGYQRLVYKLRKKGKGIFDITISSVGKGKNTTKKASFMIHNDLLIRH